MNSSHPLLSKFTLKTFLFPFGFAQAWCLLHTPTLCPKGSILLIAHIPCSLTEQS